MLYKLQANIIIVKSIDQTSSPAISIQQSKNKCMYNQLCLYPMTVLTVYYYL